MMEIFAQLFIAVCMAFFAVGAFFLNSEKKGA